MAKFKYGMQNIFELKKKLEDRQKMALAAARIRLTDEEDKLENLYARKKSYEAMLRESYMERLNINTIRISARAFDGIDYFIGLQKIEVKKAEGKVVIEQDRMIEAMKERKIQEKLRDKAFNKFLKEIDYEEAAAVDELVAYKYSLKESEEE